MPLRAPALHHSRAMGAPASLEGREGGENALEEEGPTWRLKVAVSINQVAQGIFITVPFTLAAYMVRQWEGRAVPGGEGGASEEVVGRLAGLLAASAPAAQVLTAFAWGWTTDRIGSKPVLLTANSSAAASMVCLGLAPHLTAAVATRFIGGLFSSGNAVAVKAMIGRSGSAASQAPLMGWMVAGWGLGTIMGPVIGGALALPCQGWIEGGTLCEEGALLQARPFLLPCLASAGIACLALAQNIFLLNNAHPQRAQHFRTGTGSASQGSPNSGLMPQPIRSARAGGYERLPAQVAPLADEDASGPPDQARAPSLPSSASSRTLQLARVAGVPRAKEQAGGPAQPISSAGPQPMGAPALREGAGATDSWKDADAAASASATGSWKDADAAALASATGSWEDADAAAPAGAADERVALLQSGQAVSDHERGGPARSLVASSTGDSVAARGAHGRGSTGRAAAGTDAGAPWYRSSLLLAALAGACAITFVLNYVDELTPIYASASYEAGGLGMAPKHLAGPLALAGGVLVLYSIFGYPRTSKALGQLACVQVGMAAMVPASCLLAAAALCLPEHTGEAMAVLLLALVVRSVAKTLALSSSTILINSIAPKHSMGSVNGAAQTAQSLARAVGPASAGLVWGAFSTSSGGLHHWGPFLCGAAASLACMGSYRWLGRSALASGAKAHCGQAPETALPVRTRGPQPLRSSGGAGQA